MKRIINSNSITVLDDNDNELLCITEQLSNGVMDFRVSGKLSTEVSCDFEDELTACAGVCMRINLDLGAVTYISSVALRALLSVQQLIDEYEEAMMYITAINKSVLDVFKENGFDQIFIIDSLY